MLKACPETCLEAEDRVSQDAVHSDRAPRAIRYQRKSPDWVLAGDSWTWHNAVDEEMVRSSGADKHAGRPN